MLKVLVTGGAGFIGSALVRRLIREEGAAVVNIDKLTYAGNLASLIEVKDSPNLVFHRVDILETGEIEELLNQHKPDAVFHLAAESHVDRSIDGPGAFLQTNLLGTYSMLQASRVYWQGLNASARERFRFIHISTDEVYGSLGPTGAFTEETQYQPNSPYSASKAGSDHLVRAWHHTYGLPTITTNCSNNYGPYQFPEKLIPLTILKASSGGNIPIYGKGDNIRDWLYVDDHVDALWTAYRKGKPGETYNVGGESERTNLEVAHAICTALDERLGKRSHRELITFVQDRPGHDKRYAMDIAKIRRELQWSPKTDFETGIQKTVDWYLENRAWCETVSKNQYQGERLGTLRPGEMTV